MKPFARTYVFELNRLTLLTYNKINMKKLTFLKSLLMALCLLGGGTSALADRVYFNDFSTGNGITAPAGLTIHGDGTFVDDADANFGKVFQNGGGAQRTH